jgi:tRNA (cmo5U34)-methyltransferase
MSFPMNPGDVESYADRVARHVPGLRDMHRMCGLLLAERVPSRGRVLALGAGGGLELKAFAEMHPDWHFDGVDPSPEMIEQANTILGDKVNQVRFHQGYIDDAPEGPFDGATCLLTLHFLPREERVRTVREVHRRLRFGAPFVIAHHSFPNTGVEQEKWLRRNAALLVSSGFPAAAAENGIAAMKEQLPVLSPAEDEAVLREAGFRDVELFYAGFTFKGWVAYRS